MLSILPVAICFCGHTAIKCTDLSVYSELAIFGPMARKNVRDRIIETASRLFYEKGYNQTGINQIIDEAGVAKASMYQHFRSKEDLAVAYLQRRHIWWMAQLEGYTAQELLPKARVLRCFDFLGDWLAGVNYRGCGWQNIIADLPEDQQKIREQALYHKNELRIWLHEALEQDEEFTAAQAIEKGDQVLILIEGAMILSQIQDNRWPIDTARQTCELLLS